MLSAGTLARRAASCGFNESGALENTSSGQESASCARSKSNSGVRQIIWEYWRMAGRQAEYHYRAAGEIDLGEIK
jgi:hypothetical protein